MTNVFKSLFRLMMTQPKEAGRQMIAMDLPAQVLWMTLTLISVSVSLLASGMLHLVPLPDDEIGNLVRNAMPYTAPLIFALANWGNAVLSVFIFLWVGRIFGGTGRTKDVLAIIVLLQGTAVVLLMGLVLLGVLLPVLSSLMMLVVALWAVWAMIALLDVAHDFRSMAKAGGTFLIAAFGVPLGLSFFTGAIAALTAGVS